jgi:hypothetical protein
MLIYITEVVTDDIDLQKGDELWYARYVCYNCGLSPATLRHGQESEGNYYP